MTMAADDPDDPDAPDEPLALLQAASVPASTATRAARVAVLPRYLMEAEPLFLMETCTSRECLTS